MLRPTKRRPSSAWLSPATGWVLLIALLLAVGWTVMYIYTLPQGDDLSYGMVLGSADGPLTGVYPAWKVPFYWARHWLCTNGRVANLMAALVLGGAPKWVASAICGAATGAMYVLILHFCRLLPSRGRGMAAMTVVAVVACLFPWWDSFNLVDVSLNYVWVTAMVLLALWMVERADRRRWLAAVGAWATWRERAVTIVAALVCLLAGMGHEAASLPVVVGIAWVAYTSGRLSRQGWRELSRARRVMLGWFLAGSVLVVLAPGIVNRALIVDRIADDPWWLLVVKSTPLTLVLALAMLAALLRRAWRRRLRELLWSAWGFWAVSALVGMPIVAFGGIVGRSGWFSQVAAVVALCQWADACCRWRLSRGWAAGVAVALGAAVVAQMAGVAAYSHKVWLADSAMRASYVASPDGIVCCDLPDDSELPAWLFSRVRVVRPEEDYIHLMMKIYYHKDSMPVLLPAAAAAIDWESLGEWTDPGDPEVSISTACPEGTVFPTARQWVGWYVGRQLAPDGRRRWVIPFVKDGRRYYYIRPFRPRWGERFGHEPL